MKKLITSIISLIFLINFVFADITVVPYGAAQTVSGSCFLLSAEDESVLIDCGLFMDNSNEASSNALNSDMPKELAQAKALFLTHAHLDHCGRVPLLISKGFKGEIYSTAATKELALALFMERNGFDIVERKWFWSRSRRERAQKRNVTAVAHWDEACRKNIKNIEQSDSPLTLVKLRKNYGTKFIACKNCAAKETAEIEKLFVTVFYNNENKFSENIKFKFIDAGHIPGSASIIFNINGRKVLFSGDLGSGFSRLNGEFSIPEKADLIFMEATYAEDKPKPGFADYDVFQNDLAKAAAEGKIIWIPALAFNRTQKILYELRLMQSSGKLSKDFPIHSISPSANNITGIYQKELKNKEGVWFSKEIYKAGSILPENLNTKSDVKFDKPLIVVSSSGDMGKGMSARIARFLLPRKDVEVMIVNYAGPKSTAGLLLSGHDTVKGIKNGTHVKKYDIFSDHADFNLLKKWLSGQDKKTAIYITHSEKENAAKMKELLTEEGRAAAIAVFKEKIVLADR
ncbi:MAG: MBL fold metallo-hydrolase [Endomicrobia bacterium]|nr:MBL fold metallo-hydrolase [Endomicrobiia bacterium]